MSFVAAEAAVTITLPFFPPASPEALDSLYSQAAPIFFQESPLVGLVAERDLPLRQSALDKELRALLWEACNSREGLTVDRHRVSFDFNPSKECIWDVVGLGPIEVIGLIQSGQMTLEPGADVACPGFTAKMLCGQWGMGAYVIENRSSVGCDKLSVALYDLDGLLACADTPCAVIRPA